MSDEKMVKAFVLRKITSKKCETSEYDYVNFYPILGVYSTIERALQKIKAFDFGRDFAEVYEEYVPESAIEKEMKTVYRVITEIDTPLTGKIPHVFREYDNRKDADNCVDILIATSTRDTPNYGPVGDIRFYVNEIQREI